MNYERSARVRPKKVESAGKENEDHLDTLLSFKDKNQFARKSPRSPIEETKQKQVEQSKDLVMGRRIQMAAKQEKHVKYELTAKPLF